MKEGQISELHEEKLRKQKVEKQNHAKN